MIITVTGGKGGVGKSTTTLNLARELDAVAVDADLATSDLPRGRGPDIHDVLAGRAAPMDAVEWLGSVRVLSCGRTLEGARAAQLEELPRTLDLLDRKYKHVVVDTPAGLARDVGVPVACADVVLLVTTPKKPALLNALQTRELALDLDTPVAAIALNRVGPDSQIPDRLEDEFGIPTTGIPESEAVAAAQETGMPVRQADPECEALERYTELARTLQECEQRGGGARNSVGNIGP